MRYKIGDLIELIRMDDPNPVPVGERGVINRVSKLPRDEVQLGVKWNNGRTLSIILPHDEICLVTPAALPINSAL